jgi:DNA invertase Pin-like site-specific DNA recombinase
MVKVPQATKKSGRKPMPQDRAEAIKRSLLKGSGIRATARLHRASTTTVTAIKRSLETVEGTVLKTVAA